MLIAVVERGGGTGVRLLVTDEFGIPFEEGEVRACRSPEVAPTGASLKPGDINGDGAFNISDPVAHLGALFASGPLPECYVVPNADPVELTEAGLAILDYNGDGSSNIADAVGALNFLFAGAGNPPHALGEGCVELAGTCASNCQ